MTSSTARFLRIVLVAALTTIAAGCSTEPTASPPPQPTVQATPAPVSKGRILIVMSGSNKLTLRDGGIHPTGFFLNELTIPLEALEAAGYQPVIATPEGSEPVLDPGSDSSRLFGGDDAKRLWAKAMLEHLDSFHRPLSFHAVLRDGTDSYAGVFVPGGHAPMEDLPSNVELGEILKSFHDHHRPTALICHGPIALLSTANDPVALVRGLNHRSGQASRKLSKGWPYAGYHMTVFSSDEERVAEDRMLGGRVRYYPDRALQSVGGKVETGAQGESHVVVDRELVTGQNPASDHALAEAFLKMLAGAPEAAKP